MELSERKYAETFCAPVSKQSLNKHQDTFLQEVSFDLFLLQIKEDVESTELALAFQLDSNITESGVVCQPQKQPVFAYLPLRSFGFRFIIQGENGV